MPFGQHEHCPAFVDFSTGFACSLKVQPAHQSRVASESSLHLGEGDGLPRWEETKLLGQLAVEIVEAVLGQQALSQQLFIRCF